MSQYSYSTSLAHIFLLGTCGWALKNVQKSQTIALFAFSFLGLHSLLGIFRYGNPRYGDKLRRIDRLFSTAAAIIPLPLVNAQLYFNDSRMDSYVGYAHIVSALLPVVCSTFARGWHRTFNLFLLGNVTSMGLLGILNENYWALGLAFLIGVNHFVLPEIAANYQVPRTDFVIIGLCFTTIFAVNCLNDSVAGDFYLKRH